MSSGMVLARYTMSPFRVLTAAVVASSPLTVLVGGIPTQFGTSGVVGVPFAFVLVAVVLALVLVGCVAVARHVPHAAPFYAQVVRGAGPRRGLAVGAVAVVGYNALQISLYPLLGVTMVGTFGGVWWVWAAVAWLLVFGFGLFPAARNAGFLGVLMALEVTVIVMFIVGGLTHSHDGAVSVQPLLPGSWLGPGAQSVLVFAAAAVAGLETALIYAEEATEHRALRLGAFGAVALCGVLYAGASWAYASVLGLAELRGAAVEEDNQPIALLGRFFGQGIAILTSILLITSLFAAMLSFHAAVSRYWYGLAKEGVLFRASADVSRGSGGGAPVAGSLVQSVIAAVVLVPFIVAGADPMATIFTWLSTTGALCVLIVLTAAGLSVPGFFERHRRGESWLVRAASPFVGGILGLLGLAFAASNLRDLLGTEPGSRLPWLIALVVGVPAAVAVARGQHLAVTAPAVFARLGHGVPDAVTDRDPDLSDLEV